MTKAIQKLQRNLRAAILRTPEARQGMTARREGQPRDENPYKWTSNDRYGDRKRACWEAGWDAAGPGDLPVTRAHARREMNAVKASIVHDRLTNP